MKTKKPKLAHKPLSPDLLRKMNAYCIGGAANYLSVGQIPSLIHQAPRANERPPSAGGSGSPRRDRLDDQRTAHRPHGHSTHRAGRTRGRIRALKGDVLVFAHRDIFRILAARWIALPDLEARLLYLETASLSILGYDHDLDEPVIRMLNDARHSSRLPSSPKGKMTSEQT